MNTNRLTDRIIAGVRFTPATSRSIQMADEFRACLVEKAPEGSIPILDPMRMPGVSHQRVLQRVKRGQQGFSYVSRIRHNVLRVNALATKQPSFSTTSSEGV